MKVGFLLLRN